MGGFSCGRTANAHSFLPTYHPAALLRNPALKKDVWEDMKNLKSGAGGRRGHRNVNVPPMPLAEVAFPIPLRRVFDYKIPPELGQTVFDPAIACGPRSVDGHAKWASCSALHEPEAGGLSPSDLKELGRIG
jgi:hypothetical protein